MVKQLDEIDASMTPTVTAIGSVIGVALVLALVTAGLLVIGRWSHCVALGLSVCLVGSTVLSIVEVVGAFKLRSDYTVVAAPSSFGYLIGVKVVELALFACAMVIFYALLLK